MNKVSKQDQWRQQDGLVIGVDLGDKQSQVCVLGAGNQIQHEVRVPTTTPALEKWFGTLAPTLVVMEAGTHSPWVSRQIGSYLGLRPRQRDSGESQPQLRITKAGDPYLRGLPIQGVQTGRADASPVGRSKPVSAAAPSLLEM